MIEDQIEEVAANVSVLIREEMEVQHRLGQHGSPAGECPLCQAHAC